MGLRNITLVIHDWGSALGFHYAMRHESNVKGIALMEAIVMPFNWKMFPENVREIFQAFRTPEVGWDMIVNKNVFVERILLSEGIVRGLTEEEKNHYREPFRNPASRKPVWRWPNEIPIEGQPADITKAVEAYNHWLQKTKLPKLLFYATPGAILPSPIVEWCRQNLKNLKAVDIGKGIHYLQEDNPHLIGSELAKWYHSL